MPAEDIVIVGGGPAGLTTAIALARWAPRLLPRIVVLEKAIYPRDKVCAGAIGRRGDLILEGLDAAVDVPHVPIDGVSFRGHEGEVDVRLSRIGRVIRRLEFDHALAGIARTRGVRVLDGTPARSIGMDGSSAVVETRLGTLRASVIVGADGVGSLVRRAMGLGPGTLRAQVLEVDTEPVPGDRDRRLLRFDASDRDLTGYFWDFPTLVDGERLVCRGVYWLAVGARVDIRARLAARLREMGLDLESTRNKRFAERGWEPNAAVAKGPLMLVGEAAGVDPVTGEGIAQAIEWGAMAGKFLAAASGRGPVSRWQEVVRRSRLARDLSMRARVARAFYGPARTELERFLLECPSSLHIGCQHFAAEPYDRLRLAEVVLRGSARLLGARARSLLRPGNTR